MENQEMKNNGTAPEHQQERTFTQDQVNAIIGKRLAEQKQQLEAEFVQKEKELNKREISIKAKELLAEKGLPKGLADVLRYDDEESLVKAIETMETLKGFKKDDEAAAKGGKKVVEHRLETGIGYDEADPIADAFRKDNNKWQ